MNSWWKKSRNAYSSKRHTDRKEKQRGMCRELSNFLIHARMPPITWNGPDWSQEARTPSRSSMWSAKILLLGASSATLTVRELELKWSCWGSNKCFDMGHWHWRSGLIWCVTTPVLPLVDFCLTILYPWGFTGPEVFVSKRDLLLSLDVVIYPL